MVYNLTKSVLGFGLVLTLLSGCSSLPSTLNVSAILRSSNVVKTLWADYEFLKYLSSKVAREMQLGKCDIQLHLNIRSAHIVP